MASYTVDPVGGSLTTSWAKMYGVTAGDQQSVLVRLVNLGTADDKAYVRLQKSDGSQQQFRCNPKAMAQVSDPFDLEKYLVLPPGWELWGRCDNSSIGFSISITRLPQ